MLNAHVGRAREDLGGMKERNGLNGSADKADK